MAEGNPIPTRQGGTPSVEGSIPSTLGVVPRLLGVRVCWGVPYSGRAPIFHGPRGPSIRKWCGVVWCGVRGVCVCVLSMDVLRGYKRGPAQVPLLLWSSASVVLRSLRVWLVGYSFLPCEACAWPDPLLNRNTVCKHRRSIEPKSVTYQCPSLSCLVGFPHSLPPQYSSIHPADRTV